MKPARAIVYGGLTVGCLDALDAIVFFGLRNGVGPLRIFRGIAAGLVGRTAALEGGLATAALGVLIHFTIATTIVSVYYLASRRLAFLNRQPFVWGPVYGVIAYLTMNLVVIPLSAIHGTGLPSALPVLVNGLLIHIFGVGIPSALFARAAERASF